MSESKLEKARKNINEIDKEMAKLFEKRMAEVKRVAEYKAENNLPIFDASRESEVIERCSAFVDDEVIRGYYINLLRANMAVSKEYQAELICRDGCYGERLRVSLGNNGYDIHIGRGLISKAREIFNLKRRVLIITDSGVPCEYAQSLSDQCAEAEILCLSEGEDSKSIENLQLIYKKMLDFSMTRADCVVAVGGGVVGDIACYAAASFMRGVDFYNIPTTLLSQVDSSIGGKCAVNFGGVKNIVGAFYQPKGVIIDPKLLSTLNDRQIANGLSEAVKMAVCFDKELFELIEKCENTNDILEQIIIGAIKIKKQVVEADEREGGIRRALNFGHTVGHGIEACEIGRLLHGECVAIGMTAVCSDEVRSRLVPLLSRLGLPTKYDGDIDRATLPIVHDKKRDGDDIMVVYVPEVGRYSIEKMNINDFCSLVKKELGK